MFEAVGQSAGLSHYLGSDPGGELGGNAVHLGFILRGVAGVAQCPSWGGPEDHVVGPCKVSGTEYKVSGITGNSEEGRGDQELPHQHRPRIHLSPSKPSEVSDVTSQCVVSLCLLYEYGDEVPKLRTTEN